MTSAWICAPEGGAPKGGAVAGDRSEDENLEAITRLARALDTTVAELMLRAPAAGSNRDPRRTGRS